MTNDMKPATPKSNFLRQIIDADLASGKVQSIVTRFPPEPNGYLHIGHAKAICISYGLAEDYNGTYHLRFDDTNPVAEKSEYVDSIKKDIAWLGFDWGEHLYFASDYFERMADIAVGLIEKGLAYVDSLSKEKIREYRGNLNEVGKDSPYRNRSVEENLDLFEKMKSGEFDDGEVVLRAKIDMESPNIVMRDPVIYRVLKAHHHRQGDKWNIYPMYDYAHCLEDAFEKITHSLCSLEFENNRELYDWLIEKTGMDPAPHQYEFARLNLGYTVMSKRWLKKLVVENHVSGWDDPRMPTLAGMRRRGIPFEAVREFCDMIGVAKANSLVDVAMFEFAIRDELNTRAKRVMCVLDPLKLTITNYEGENETLACPYWPRGFDRDETRPVHFSKTVYIERSDFSETPPKKWKRLEKGVEVRLRYAYIIKVNEVIKNEEGEIIELLCTYDKSSKSGSDTSGKKVRRVVHWVDFKTSIEVQVNLYDRLFINERPDVGGDFSLEKELNPQSLVEKKARIETSIVNDDLDTRYQFERHGYFWRDEASDSKAIIFNRIVSLKDSWAKENAKSAPEKPKEKKSSTPRSSEPVMTWRDRVRGENAQLQKDFEEYKSLGLIEVDADVLSGTPSLSHFYKAVSDKGGNPKNLASWIVNVMLPFYDDHFDYSTLGFQPQVIANLIEQVESKSITSAAGKKIFEMIFEGERRSIQTLIEDEGFKKVTDEATLLKWIDEVMVENPKQLEMYKGGKDSLFGFFVGQVMKKSRGAADGVLVKSLLKDQL